MTVRLAVGSDIDQIIKWLRRFHSETVYAGKIEFDEASTRETVETLIDGDNSVVFISEFGVIGGIVVPFFFNGNIQQSIEIFWFAEKHGNSLKYQFERWAKSNGAKYMGMGSVPHEKRERVEKIYRAQGFIEADRVFLKEIL